MHQIITCPACQRRVQMPDEYLGRPVQCPECNQAFVAGGAATPLTSSPEASRPSVGSIPGNPPQRRPRYPVDDDDAFDDWGIRRASVRRSDRGGMILAFGILSVTLSCGLGLIFGPLAWVMGGADLAAMDNDEMDPKNRGLVQAGRIMGMVGTALSAFNTLMFVGYWLFVFSMILGHG